MDLHQRDSTTTIAYADCFSGVSGDMFLGALLDAGLPKDVLLSELAGLALSNYHLATEKDLECGIQATRVKVHLTGEQPPRTWQVIKELIEQSRLGSNSKEKALAVFACLAEAEARVHGCKVEDVHFHEIGAVDSIVDIVGSAVGLDYLGIDTIISSPLPMTNGWVKCDHGLLPLPAPAVCEILKGVPVVGLDLDLELVTPTGAALIKSMCSKFGRYPSMVPVKVGYGAGNQRLPDRRPNLFRLVLGEARLVQEAQEVEVIETHLDDWSPEGFPYLMEQLFTLGALDVCIIPIHMKKGRPGFLLRVLSSPALAFEIKKRIFIETTAIGLRYHTEQRLTLPRAKGTVSTPWGPLAVKRVETPDGLMLYPEYEDCRKMSQTNGVSLKKIYSAVACLSPKDFVEEK